ncbi:MAG: DNA-binding response regulator, partial [Chloroflexi bacterium]|nr:DNA-binding response regulator [Chloroflexota bacterium]
MDTIRLLLVDDHKVVRLGLRALLDAEPDIEVVGEAATAA